MLMQLQNFVIFRFRLSCTNNLSCQKLQRFSLRANAEQVALSGAFLLLSKPFAWFMTHVTCAHNHFMTFTGAAKVYPY